MERILGVNTLRTRVRTISYGFIKGLNLIASGLVVGYIGSNGAQHMKLLELAVLLLSIIIALRLYTRKPSLLLPYILLIWVMSPEVRRLMDWAFQSYSEISLLSIIPIGVSLTLLLPIIKGIKLIDRKISLVCRIVGIALIYGLAVGFFKYGLATVYDFMNYFVPFLVLVYVNVTRFEEDVRDKWLRGFSYLAIMVAGYGIYQYMSLPPWDKYWMLGAEMNSIGIAEPQGFRVFSLLNSPGPTGVFLAVAMAIMTVQKKWRVLGIVGIMIVAFALLLTLVRVGWIAYIVMVIAYFARAHVKHKLSLLAMGITIVAAYLLVVPLLPGANDVISRVNTFSSIEEDHSFVERVFFFKQILSEVVVNPIGKGLGGSGIGVKLTQSQDTLAAFDNGYLNLMYTFGLPLGLAIISVLVYLCIQLFKLSKFEKVYAPMSFASICGILFLLFASNILLGLSGFIMLFVISLTFAQSSSSREEN